MAKPFKSTARADEAAALVFWLITHGTTSLAKAIDRQINLLRQALLPWLASQYHYILAVFGSPLWQLFAKKLRQVLDSETAKFCHQLLRIWLRHVSRNKATGTELDSPSPAAEIPTPQKANMQTETDVNVCQVHQQRGLQSADLAPETSTDMAQELSLVRNPHKTSPGSPSSISQSKTDAQSTCSLIAGERSNLSTPSSRKPFPGSWSSGAAWLQSQATSAAAAAATGPAALQLADPPSGSRSSIVVRSGGKHRRNTPTASSFMVDKAFPDSPLSQRPSAGHDMRGRQSPDAIAALHTAASQQRRSSHDRHTVSRPRAVLTSPRACTISRAKDSSPQAFTNDLEALAEPLQASDSRSNRDVEGQTDKHADQNAASPSVRSAEQALQEASEAVETLKKRFAAREEAAKAEAEQQLPAAQVPFQDAIVGQKAQAQARHPEQTQQHEASADTTPDTRPSRPVNVDPNVGCSEQSASESPASTSDSLHDPVSPINSANAPVMWYNGATEDSGQSESLQRQNSGPECSSSEPQADAPFPGEMHSSAWSKDATLEEQSEHAQDLSTLEQVWKECQSQQPELQYGDGNVTRQTCSPISAHTRSQELQQEEQAVAAPDKMQSAGSLSTWLGSDIASRAASCRPADPAPVAVVTVPGNMDPSFSSLRVLDSQSDAVGKQPANLVTDEEYADSQASLQHGTAQTLVQDGASRNGEGNQEPQLPAPAKPALAVSRQRCAQLSVSDEASQGISGPECDIYNLESPGPIFIAGHGSTVGDSYLLALSRREATLQAWHSRPCPALLEGQGLGTFLGPPAQRWATAVALKDSTNIASTQDQVQNNDLNPRLPSSAEEGASVSMDGNARQCKSTDAATPGQACTSVQDSPREAMGQKENAVNEQCLRQIAGQLA